MSLAGVLRGITTVTLVQTSESSFDILCAIAEPIFAFYIRVSTARPPLHSDRRPLFVDVLRTFTTMVILCWICQTAGELLYGLMDRVLDRDYVVLPEPPQVKAQ
ncbi:hypothetical protein LTR15_003188 [Elasticomyces elasticus]|nr:hypothetical protein LTR15_003188 [Elasticomyces elasticus]